MVAAVQAAAGYMCGPNANYFVERWFGDCVYSSLEIFAFCVGLSSVFFWLIAQLPQFITNILRQSADALSPWFLIQWLVGDSCNFLGCVFTGDQLATQTITAGYFIFADFIILTQYLYYWHRNRNASLSVYRSDSDEWLHKPSNKFNDDPGLDKLYIQSPLTKISLANTIEVCFNHQTNEVCPEYQHYKSSTKSDIGGMIPRVKLIDKQIFLSDSHVEYEPRVDVRSSSNPNKADQESTFHPQQMLHSSSASDLNCQNNCINECSHRLGRLIQEYGLEYGQEAILQCKSICKQGLNKNKNQLAYLRRKSEQFPGPSRKAGFRVLLGVACLFGLASSNWCMAPKSSNSMNNTFGYVLGRRTLLAVPDRVALPFEENLLKLSMILGLDLSSATHTRNQLTHGSMPTTSWTKVIGRSMGWVSSTLYLGSRFPQIVKNMQRRSADGLSLGMFVCAILGNLTYGVSIILLANSWENLTGKAPWLLGSFGTVFLDIGIFIQAHYYRRCSKKCLPNEYSPLIA